MSTNEVNPEQRLAQLRAAEAAGKPIKMMAFWGHKPSTWRGLNLLGFALMDVREKL